MATEDQILKGTKFITNTKMQRLKIQSRGWIIKNTTLKKSQKIIYIYYIYILYIYSYIYMKFVLKIGDFFCKVIIGYKNEN